MISSNLAPTYIGQFPKVFYYHPEKYVLKLEDKDLVILYFRFLFYQSQFFMKVVIF